MNVIPLTPLDLALAASLVATLALVSVQMRLGLAGQIIVAGLRTTLQLLLVGLVLKSLLKMFTLAGL